MSQYISILQEKPVPRHSKTIPPDLVWQRGSPKVLKKVQSGPMWADKKNDPYPVKKAAKGKLFLLPPGKTHAGEVAECYLVQGVGRFVRHARGA
jgi:hypothetical protein